AVTSSTRPLRLASPLTVGATLIGVTTVVRLTALSESLIGVVPPLLVTLRRSPVFRVVELASTQRALKPTGLPCKLSAGLKRIWSDSPTKNAFPALTAGMAVHVAPLSVEYCHTPWAAVAALPVIAIPAKPFASEPSGLAL